MTAPAVFKVTPFYSDPARSQAESEILMDSACAAYDYSDYSVLADWALHCSSVSGREAKLVMLYWGSLLLETYLRIDPDSWNSGVFGPWVDTVFRDCVNRYYEAQDNKGSWAILGAILADMVLDQYPTKHLDRLNDHMFHSFNSRGVMIHEIKRTNSGIWYSYFSLAPMLRACQVVCESLARRLKAPLDWLFQYCLDPDSWPYRPKTGLLGRIQQMLYPHAPELDKPQRNGWGGNLYYEAGRMFSRPDWMDWAQPPFNQCIFRNTHPAKVCRTPLTKVEICGKIRATCPTEK